MMEFCKESMPEAEVTLRMAFRLMDCCGPGSCVETAIDGAHVRIREHHAKGSLIAEQRVFEVAGFLWEHNCDPSAETKDWQGDYVRDGSGLKIKSQSGPDVQISLGNRRISVECKGGPLKPIPGKSPNTILTTAIGQILCSGDVAPGDELWVAVPDSPQFRQAAERVSRVLAFQKTGISLAVVGRDGCVHFASKSDWVELDRFILLQHPESVSTYV